MRKMLVLMTLTLMTTNSAGCCCRGLRDWLFQGSCCPCLSGASTYPTATYVPAPACASPCAAPTYAPTYTPAYTAAPMAAVAAPQYTMAAPMAAVAPMATSCGDPCAGGCSPCSSGCSTCGGGCSTCGGGCSGGCSTCGSPCAVEASCGTPVVMGTAYMAEPSCSYPDGAAPAPTAVYPSPAAE
jgi:hypothetical protein